MSEFHIIERVLRVGEILCVHGLRILAEGAFSKSFSEGLDERSIPLNVVITHHSEYSVVELR